MVLFSQNIHTTAASFKPLPRESARGAGKAGGENKFDICFQILEHIRESMLKVANNQLTLQNNVIKISNDTKQDNKKAGEEAQKVLERMEQNQQELSAQIQSLVLQMQQGNDAAAAAFTAYDTICVDLRAANERIDAMMSLLKAANVPVADLPVTDMPAASEGTGTAAGKRKKSRQRSAQVQSSGRITRSQARRSG